MQFVGMSNVPLIKCVLPEKRIIIPFTFCVWKKLKTVKFYNHPLGKAIQILR
ncbi:hypothetical protein DI53_0013 [Sphingobacterium deserti]|uniref:Uncharacterized protein n=1 Tax=Sphingobacterium deserti TaxID=1229276 RepID=A0A0B8TCT6_9SPHI|nr:hypothetical protein DI53_0013 [Sphingobacterium deserti]